MVAVVSMIEHQRLDRTPRSTQRESRILAQRAMPFPGRVSGRMNSIQGVSGRQLAKVSDLLGARFGLVNDS